MKTIKKYFFWIIVLALVISIIIFIGHVSSKKIKSNNIEVHHTKKEKKRIYIYGNDDQYILAKGFHFVGNRYLIDFDFYINEKDKSKNYTGFLSYDIENNMKENKVEVLKEIKKKYPKAYLAREGSNYGIINRNGKNLVWMRFYKTPTSKEYNEIFYNLDKQMFVLEDSINSDYLQIDAIVYSYTNLADIVVDATGYNIGSSIQRNRYLKLNKDDLNIFKENPELKEKLSKDRYTLYIRPRYLSNEEYFNTLIHWFAPTGQDRISGVKIDAYYSKDGQEHEIHSYDEFKQFYNGKGGELNE